MGKVTGFLEYQRELPARRPVEKRINEGTQRAFQRPADLVESPRDCWILNDYQRAMGVAKSKEQYRPPHTFSQPAKGRCMDRALQFCDTVRRPADSIESLMARWILDNFATMPPQFAKAFPHPYKCVMGVTSQPAKGEVVHG